GINRVKHPQCPERGFVVGRRLRWRSQPRAALSIAGHRIGGHPLTAVLILTGAMLLQGGLGAALYFQWGELGSYRNAFYFSIASFSTVGASELVLSPEHRLVGALEAAMGMLMFGWSAALLVHVVQEDARLAASE